MSCDANIMAGLLVSLLVCVLCSCFVATAKLPNIVFVLVDDWGFADVGFRNPAISSPNFDHLAKTGLVLNRHYVFKYCSPSRASFLTGRWPHHAHQWNLPQSDMAGTNLNMTMIPAKLKAAKYSTHMVGKWHQGFFDPRYLPINRGFDTSSGFLGGGEDHMTQEAECAIDYWKNDAPDPRNGTYDAYNYGDDLTDIMNNHNVNDPLFIYLPLHNVHAPLQAPDEWLNIYSVNSTCENRRTYQAMVSVADNVTGYLVQLLKKKGMWDNTIIIISADNGGAACGGSNYPLKGCKGSFFEGGVRALAFVNGGLLPESRRGESTDGFIHIADWYTTFCKLAGVDPDDSGTGKFPVDGLDVWPIITGENEKTQHEEIVLGYNFDNVYPSQGAIIVNNYKLVVGLQGHGCDSLMWSALDYPCSYGPEGPDCDPYCLYDIVNDPTEKKDLSKENPDMLKKLVERYNSYSKEPRDMQDQGYHSEDDIPKDPNACKYMADNGGYWRPWKNI
ncbi:PREDICTED: arylsulfatase J-like isoform X1 [Amphimedon queenslandica]|uniref:Sulfatase N-terminal domain-containing protein n=1 Tax=Amphimedon queenslandica TaxID=400682 RepID=A0AAN0J6Q4_AMPQE|nr:PREDICTED: arylsulfatase J-like isoform X1 [Amphimedon queenslandica]|eukprot:XP_019852368.1 PREDICTED: arylsulfatase J-like isoform X1 [Amphimedon queenslandica]